MLSEQEIREALHAGRVMPVDVPNPHGPLGLEQLAEAVRRAAGASSVDRVRRPLELRPETWAKLDGLARAASKQGSQPLSASDVAAALIEQVVRAG